MKDLSSKQVLLTTLAGVEKDVQLEGDFVVGRWKSKREVVSITNKPSKPNTASPVEDFVNMNSERPEAILRFTQRYGPLSPYPETGNLEFRQSLKEWRDFQAHLRWLWTLGKNSSSTGPMHTGDSIRFEANGRVSRINLHSLRWFLEFSITSVPSALRRVCDAEWATGDRPRCGRYFIGARKDAHLCGRRRCADEVRKKFMRDWWSREGKEWRARRKKKKAKTHQKVRNPQNPTRRGGK